MDAPDGEKSRDELLLELEEYKKRFTAVLNSPKLPSVIIGQEGVVLSVNKMFCDVSGFEAREVVGQSYIEMFVPEESKTQTRNILNMIMSGFVEFLQYVEGDIITRDGRKISIGWNNSVLRNTENQIVAMCSLGEDLSNKLSRGNMVPPVEETRGSSAQSKTVESLPSPTRRRPSFDFRRDELPMYETIGDYLVVQRIGGDNSKVKLGMHKITTDKVAIKSLSKAMMSDEEKERARREIEIMKRLTSINNPHIVKLKESYESEESFTIVMEYVKGGELVSTILKSRDLTEQKVHRWFKQILFAIETCHRNNVVHRDIKLQNILLDEHNQVKLIDFGLSNYVEDGVFRSTFCGTPAYASPEILLGNKYEGPEVDVWSLGVVLFSMLTANFPFTTVGDILIGKFEEPKYVSPACLSLLKRMLCVDTEKRITLQGIINDSWVQHGPDPYHTHNFPIAYEHTSLELERQQREMKRQESPEERRQAQTPQANEPPAAYPPQQPHDLFSVQQRAQSFPSPQQNFGYSPQDTYQHSQYNQPYLHTAEDQGYQAVQAQDQWVQHSPSAYQDLYGYGEQSFGTSAAPTSVSQGSTSSFSDIIASLGPPSLEPPQKRVREQ